MNIPATSDRLRLALADRCRIERELGAGGMATVYLAHDVRHDRKVAIKVLKPELAAVLGAERFVQEIKTTAALSHPHILPLFDSGTADGFLFYVMPYIKGETIREKLNRETQFGVDEAVRTAREVADALDYAHRNGVIHRDIKPENILLHDGRAMVMDFGIALAVSAAAGGRMTETGLSLGTPHYMSPEQATAEKEISARSDIYSLASVLYEMLAGQPPHHGGSAQQVIMKILTEPAQPVTVLRKAVPPNVAAALDKALEKLPADRFESAKAFSEALSNSGFTTNRRAPAATGGRLASPKSWSRATSVMAAIATVLAVGLGLTLTQRDTSPAATNGVIQFALNADDSMAVDAGSTRPFAFSPDGKSIVFRASRDSIGARLWIRTLGDPVARPIDGTEDGMNPVFSPDGEWIAFITQNVSIKKVRAAGGAVTPIIRTPSRTAALAWGDDDNIYFEQLGSGEGIHRVAASGGRAEVAIPIDTASDEVAQRRPVIIPGTGTIAFSSGSRGGGEPTLHLFRISDSRRVPLDLQGIGALAYFDGRLVYSRSDGTLMAAPVDVRGMKPEGPPVPLEPRVAATSTGTAVSISPQGTLVYGATPVGGLLPLALVDTSGRVRMLRQRVQPGTLLFSPDGRRVLLGSPGQPGAPDAQDLQVIDVATEVSTKLRTSGNALYVSWSADGKRLHAPKNANGVTEVMNVPLDGAPESRLVSIPAAGGGSAMAMPDGRSLVYGAVFERTGGFGIVRAWIDGSGTLDTLVLESRDRIAPYRPRVSPDGRAIAFIERNTGDVYVQSLSGGGALQVSELPSRVQRPVVWGADSRHLYYSGATGLNIILVETSPVLRVVRRMVKPGFPIGLSYDLSPDGTTFITNSPNNPGVDIWVAVNWLDEARRVWGKR